MEQLPLAFLWEMWYYFFVIAGVMELVDVADSKSAGLIPRVGSSPTTGTSYGQRNHYIALKASENPPG